MRYPAYPAYRDSRFEWLGELPENWEVRRLKNVLACPVTDGPHTTPEFVYEGVPFLSVDGIQNGELQFDGCRFVSVEDHKQFTKKVAPKRGDLLLGKAASTGKIAQVKVDFEFSIWSPLALLRADPEVISSTFLEYLLKSPAVQAQIDMLCTHNTQSNISMDDIPKLVFPVPPSIEQQSIAAFLDWKTGQIDALIAKKKELLEKLKEKRLAVITQAVTKGLNPAAPLRDSGIPWLGKVPKHWEIRCLNFCFDSLNSRRIPLSAEERANMSREYPYYGASGVIDYVEEYIFDEQLILIAEDGANLLSRSTPLAFEARGKYWVNNHAHILRPTLGPFAYWSNLLCIVQYEPWITGAAQPKLTKENLGAIPLPCPPRDEQEAIATFIEKQTGRIDPLINFAMETIARLTEYRTALITAATTGKIDVRKVAVPSPA